MNKAYFSDAILGWYKRNKRDLPWRSTSDPYKIWISEVILQQTRIDQGIPYYLNFIEAFPNIFTLANASEDQVLKLWQGLGYYSRARNLHFGAKQIVNDYNGIFPENALTLKKIKGIGEYTAAAIASIAYNEPIAAIDGNVYRVLSRIFGLDTPIDASKGINEFKKLGNSLIDKTLPGDYNQAIMEFGALNCRPKIPKCETCPFLKFCFAFNNHSIEKYPTKSKKIKIKKRYFYYLCIELNKNFLYFKKRIENDIWRNLHDFPLIETEKKMNLPDLIASNHWQSIFMDTEISIIDISKDYTHLLTHQKINVKFIHLTLNKQKKLPTNFIKIDKKNIFELAVPKVIENYMLEYGLID